MVITIGGEIPTRKKLRSLHVHFEEEILHAIRSRSFSNNPLPRQIFTSNFNVFVWRTVFEGVQKDERTNAYPDGTLSLFNDHIENHW